MAEEKPLQSLMDTSVPVPSTSANVQEKKPRTQAQELAFAKAKEARKMKAAERKVRREREKAERSTRSIVRSEDSATTLLERVKAANPEVKVPKRETRSKQSGSKRKGYKGRSTNEGKMSYLQTGVAVAAV